MIENTSKGRNATKAKGFLPHLIPQQLSEMGSVMGPTDGLGNGGPER